MEQIEIKLLHEDAKVPVRANPTDSGLDLYALKDVEIKPFSTVVVPTGIAINLADGFEAQARPKSGITSKTKARVQLGTIDTSYPEEIGVIVDNIGHTPLKLEKGKKIAQLVVVPVVYPEPVIVDTFSTEKNRGGFGSTGLD